MNAADLTDDYEKALGTYERMLAFEMDEGLRSNIHKKIGDIHLEISKHRDRKENCGRAIASYKKALETFSREHFPIQYANANNGLGSAYGFLAEIEERDANLRASANAYEEALKVYSQESPHYAPAQIRLGNICSALSEIDDLPGNCKKA
jgi:tetratricopeptide (TPR) repeat protein